MIAIFAMRTSNDYDESERSQSKDTLPKCMTIGVQTKKKLTNNIFIYYRTGFNEDLQLIPGAYVYNSDGTILGRDYWFLKERDRRPETRMTTIVCEAFRKLLQKWKKEINIGRVTLEAWE